MITASEPLEFVPHGRTVLAKHPVQIYNKGHNNSASENSLLYKLANFAIKDESLLDGRENNDKEWWCVREVYYRECEEDESLQSQRDSKLECMSESFRPISRLKNEYNVSIKWELQTIMKKTDPETSGGTGGTSTSGSNGSVNSSTTSKRFNLIQNKSSPKFKSLNPKTDCYYEEELYVKGCTAVWSKGFNSTPATKLSNAEQRETIACYTVENQIKHATFCNFFVNIKNNMLIDALNSQIGDVKQNIRIEDSTEHIKTEIMPCIVLIDSKCMRVFATDGREYMTSIPFQVKKVWPVKYGILLEKDATPLIHNTFVPTPYTKMNDTHGSTFSRTRNYPSLSAKLRSESISGYDQDYPLPTCFSLGHPLDEVTPVLIKQSSQNLHYFNDSDIQIIFVSSKPSIMLLYDWKAGTHSLWTIRRTIRDECLAMCPNVNSTTTVFSHSCDFVNSPMHSNVRSMTGVGSPMFSRKDSNTPSRSKPNSPMAHVFLQQGLSPHHSAGQASSASMLGNTVPPNPPALPLYPDVCLDYIWTDPQIIRRDPIESDSEVKTLLHTDLVGSVHLCFMVKAGGISRLQMIRLERTQPEGHSQKTSQIISTPYTVLAKDFVNLVHLNMLALIDESGNIILQSGNNVVGKVHVGGVLARLIDSPYTKRSAFQSPFPRRSSLLPSRCQDATFDDSALHLLSPVPHTSSNRIEQRETIGLCGLGDAAGSRMTLTFDSGVMYRISLPELASSILVLKCCTVIKTVLPKSVAMEVIIKWYGVRNAPGTQDLTPEQEWLMFTKLLFTLLGYDYIQMFGEKQNEDQEQMEVASKKQRTSSDGTQDDWEYLLNTKLHRTIGKPLNQILKLQMPNVETKRPSPILKAKSKRRVKTIQFNKDALLVPFSSTIVVTFHLLYEDLKLNTFHYNDLRPLAGFLYELAKDLRFWQYVIHYWKDFPTEFDLEVLEFKSRMGRDLAKWLDCDQSLAKPDDIFVYLNSMLNDVDIGHYRYLDDVNTTSRNIIEVLATAGYGSNAGAQLLALEGASATAPGIVGGTSTPRCPPTAPHTAEQNAAAVLMLCQKGICVRGVEALPAAVWLAVLGACAASRFSPPAHWPPAALRLALRPDLALHHHAHQHADSHIYSIVLEVLDKETVYTLVSDPGDESTNKSEDENITGMEHLNTKLLSLLYPRDHRMREVFNMLQSSMPVTINLTQRPDVSDHDYIEEQEKLLYAFSTRTMALPVGRGMLTLRSLPCAPTEPLTIPKLCVSGRGPPPRCSNISLPGGEASHSLQWPSFHNGVAAGLALVPMTGSSIDSSWIIYNKPRGTVEMSAEHAGFLMALGLNGHLKDMPFMHIYEYLVKCHEMCSVGLLLGLAATYRGTKHVQATKMMSIHLEPLLPATSMELEIHQSIAVAALMGIGLLYQGTGHTHLAHVLLNEIGKPPGPEMENCVEREGYALAAGLALGAVCVGSGPTAPRHVPQRLRTYMMGGDKHPLTGSQREKYKQGSFAIREGRSVNLDVTAPGATLALGLLYLRAGAAGRAVADWLKPPHTPYLLDYVRPDLLMLRVIARGLILWDSIEPTVEWLENQVPSTIRPYCFVKPVDENIDYEAMNQAYCNIVAGACFAMGIRFAGSGDEDARDAVLHSANLFLAVSSKSFAELAGRSTLEACLCVTLIAAGMIMCGRGDVHVLRVCRRLRVRVAPTQSTHAITHGAQMAVHMATGLVSLGGGRATLSTSAPAVCALLAAFFPKLPTHSEDNRYHLQAFRHLYVLAVEPRLILPRDIDTGKLCYAHIKVINLKGIEKELKAPCIIPELDTLREVTINDPRYWPITFQRDHNWDKLKAFLEHTWCIDIKQRAGCLSYVDDPHGYLTILAQTLTLDNSHMWSGNPENIELFTNDEKIRNFIKHHIPKYVEKTVVCGDCLLVPKKRRGVKNEILLCKECTCRKYTKDEQEYVQNLCMVTYECVIKDILHALPIWTTFLKIMKAMKDTPSSYQTWQIKLLLSQIDNYCKQSMNQMKIDGQDQNEPLISNEFSQAIKQKVCSILDSWETKIAPYLKKYLEMPSNRSWDECDDQTKMALCSFVVYHELPRALFSGAVGDTELEVILRLGKGLSPEGLSQILSLLR